LIPPFDIFHVAQDNQPVWLEPASTLDGARARVKELGKSRPGEYFILSQITGRKISITVAPPEKLGT
jgi:hypothetical protein